MRILENPYRGQAISDQDWGLTAGEVSDDVEAVARLMALCPVAKPTPLHSPQALADALGIAGLAVKDERGRMGLGSFKALGAAYAIAKRAVAAIGGALDPDTLGTALKGQTFVCASAGNHGLSLAAGARVFGAHAVVYLSETVPDAFAQRLIDKGAQVVREGADYEASMAAALAAADANGWTLLSDSTWPGSVEGGRDVMEGYTLMAEEAVRQWHEAMGAEPPSHIYLQAGVGGLAAGSAVLFRKAWGDAPRVVVVEPDAAPALFASIQQGRLIETQGPSSDMGRLDCKVASHLALKALARMADAFQLISDEECAQEILQLANHELAASPSGGAGFAGLALSAAAGQLPGSARALVIVSEGPT